MEWEVDLKIFHQEDNTVSTRGWQLITLFGDHVTGMWEEAFTCHRCRRYGKQTSCNLGNHGVGLRWSLFLPPVNWRGALADWRVADVHVQLVLNGCYRPCGAGCRRFKLSSFAKMACFSAGEAVRSSAWTVGCCLALYAVTLHGLSRHIWAAEPYSPNNCW